MIETQFITFLISVLAITNPFGNLVIFIGLTNNKSANEARLIALTTTLAVGVILVLATWSGDFILKFLGISLPAFELAGALIITLLGLSLLNAKKSDMSYSKEEHLLTKGKDAIAIVPLAMPIIVGPGAITTLILYSHKYPGLTDRLWQTTGDILVTVFIGFVLVFSNAITRRLGIEGLKILTRVMGLILVAMAMQMFVDAIKTII